MHRERRLPYNRGMRYSLVAALLALLVAPSFADFSGALGPLRDAVHARQETVDGSTRRGRRQLRALVAAETGLTRESQSVGDDLRALERCAKRLARRFGGDAVLTPPLHQALGDLGAVAREERDEFAAAAGTLGDAAGERRLSRALEKYDVAADRAATARYVWQSARKLRVGWKKITKVSTKLGLGRLPDFSLRDANPSSSRHGRAVSPRDFLGKISAYYFGHAT